MSSFSSEFHTAIKLLESLRKGDRVRVTLGGREMYEMTVTREIHRDPSLVPGQQLGSYESAAVTVSLGPGRYSTEVTAERLAPRTVGGNKNATALPGFEQSLEIISRAADRKAEQQEAA